MLPLLQNLTEASLGAPFFGDRVKEFSGGFGQRGESEEKVFFWSAVLFFVFQKHSIDRSFCLALSHP